MEGRLAETVRKLGYPRVLVVGDLILDRFVWGQVNRISPEAPIQVLHVSREESRLGGAGNVAHNLATLGARVHCCGFLGKDDGGREIRGLLRKSSIDGGAIVQASPWKTPVKTRMIAHSQQVLRVDQEEVRSPDGVFEKRLIAAIRPTIRRVQAVAISDYRKGCVTRNILRATIEEARRRRVPVVVGPKGKDFSIYRGATGIVPNLSELSQAVGVEIAGSDELRAASLRAASQKLLRSLGLEFVVVTLGEKGMAYFDRRGRAVHVPAQARSVYDVTGAGDTVLGLLALLWAEAVEPEDAVRLANLGAGLVVGKLGTATLEREEILGELSGATMPHARKILGAAFLLRRLGQHRRLGQRVVFTNGCFDLLHPGHLRSLRYAKAQGDVLVVAVNSDRSARKLKGDGRPVLPLEARMEIVAGLEEVDYVVAFEEGTPERLIRKFRPDVLVKGADWASKEVVGAEFVRKQGGRVTLCPVLPGYSTTELLSRIRNHEG